MAFSSSSMHLVFSASSGCSMAARAEPLMIGILSPGNFWKVRTSRISLSTSSMRSGSSTMSTLFRKTMMEGTPTWRARRMCSRVWGMTESGADDHEHRAVHLGRAGDHVLDVVGVARAVDVRVVALVGLVLDVPGVDRDAAGLLLGRVVDILVLHHLVAVLLGAIHGDGRGERRLSVVDMADRPHVDVRLVPDEFLLRHTGSSSVAAGTFGGRPRNARRESRFPAFPWGTRLASPPSSKLLAPPSVTMPGAARLLHDRFLDRSRRFLVVGELHGVGGAPLGHGAQGGRVPEHRT